MKKFLFLLAIVVISMAAMAQETLPDAKLKQFAKEAVEGGKTWMGYPTVTTPLSNLDGYYDWYIESGLSHLPLNNAGDPFDGRTLILSSANFEKEVILWFAPYYGFTKDNVWGLISASGTDGNNHGIYFGEKYLESLVPDIKPIAYVSKESHYSNMRLCDLQNIEVKLIDTDSMGRMKPESLRDALDPSRPALMIYSMGSTFMGAIDDQEALNKVVDEVNPVAVYRHVDAALFGGYLPFTQYKDMVSQKECKYNSIAISGHKFFGIDTPCGIFLTTQDVIKKQSAFAPEYLNSNMFMINCSRSGQNPLKFYWIIKRLGEKGLSKQANALLDNTDYLKNKLDSINWPAWKNDFSNTVFFKRPSDNLITKYSLAKGHLDGYGDLSHIVVMQQVNRDAIDAFIVDLSMECNPGSVDVINGDKPSSNIIYNLKGIKTSNQEKGILIKGNKKYLNH